MDMHVVGFIITLYAVVVDISFADHIDDHHTVSTLEIRLSISGAIVAGVVAILLFCYCRKKHTCSGNRKTVCTPSMPTYIPDMGPTGMPTNIPNAPPYVLPYVMPQQLHKLLYKNIEGPVYQTAILYAATTFPEHKN